MAQTDTKMWCIEMIIIHELLCSEIIIDIFTKCKHFEVLGINRTEKKLRQIILLNHLVDQLQKHLNQQVRRLAK